MISYIFNLILTRQKAEWLASLHEALTIDQNLAAEPLTKEQVKDMGILVNSDQYPAFRTFLRSLAVGHFMDGRRRQDETTHAYNRIGQLLLEIIAGLDTYREKQDTPIDADEYDI